MTRVQTAAVRAIVEDYVARIEVHLVRLAQGHDPFGHLFAIERLARSARADWCAVQRQAAPGRDER